MERDTDLQCPSCTQRGRKGRAQKQVRVGLGAPLACEPRGRPGQCPLAVGLLTPPVPREANQALLSQNSGLGFYCCSAPKSCLTPYDTMDCSAPGFPVLHCLLELAQTHIYQVGDAIQPSHPLLSPSPAFSLSQHQGLFKQVSSSHQVAKVLEL